MSDPEQVGGKIPRVAVHCRLFARYAELAGTDAIDLDLPTGATVEQAVRALRTRFGDGVKIPARPLAAVNREHAEPGRVLADGDELALLPPLAGG
ncbi:MAG: MoaD/ThiS family protein [Gemmatimonadales bacterium]|jgi:molybdopterin synthase catalytic subunit|nr:MoaD/ThiS family protein [Gemmatimonadales bacterium]